MNQYALVTGAGALNVDDADAVMAGQPLYELET